MMKNLVFCFLLFFSVSVWVFIRGDDFGAFGVLIQIPLGALQGCIGRAIWGKMNTSQKEEE